MTDFQVTDRAVGVAQDTRWRWSAHGEDSARPGQLDISKLGSEHQTNGRAPSGLALGQITATKLYGPYDPAATDGREKLAGFLNDNLGVEVRAGGKPTIAVLKHGIIKASRLPVPSQRSAVVTAGNGAFTFVED